MNKIIMLSAVTAALLFTGCEEKKTTEEQLKENTKKEVELIKKSISEKASEIEDAIKK